jgi:hypothetical protein
MLQRILLACASLIAFSVEFSSSSSVNTYSDCSKGTSQFRILNYTLTPTNIYHRDSIVSVLDYVNNGLPVKNGTIKTDIAYDRIQFYSHTKPLCNRLICPIQSGINSVSSSFTWPFFNGTLINIIKWSDVYDRLLLCINITVITLDDTKPVDSDKTKGLVLRGRMDVVQTRMFKRPF